MEECSEEVGFQIVFSDFILYTYLNDNIQVHEGVCEILPRRVPSVIRRLPSLIDRSRGDDDKHVKLRIENLVQKKSIIYDVEHGKYTHI